MKRQLPLQLFGCVVALTLVIVATGCNDTKKKPATNTQATSNYGLDYMDSGTASTTYDTTTTDPYTDTSTTASTTVDTSWTDSVGASTDAYSGYGTTPVSGNTYPASTPQPSYNDTYAAAPATTAAGGRIHVVRKKETLSTIALQYYGRKSWKRIYDANRNQISDPNKIYPGMQLVIP